MPRRQGLLVDAVILKPGKIICQSPESSDLWCGPKGEAWNHGSGKRMFQTCFRRFRSVGSVPWRCTVRHFGSSGSGFCGEATDDAKTIWQNKAGKNPEKLIGRENAEYHGYITGIFASSRSILWQRSCQLLSTMLDDQLLPDIKSFNVTMASCKKVQEWQQVLSLLSWMIQLKVVDVVTCNAALSSLSSGWQRTIHFLDSISNLKIQRDVISFNTTITSCEKAQQWQHALALFQALNET